MDLTYSQLLNFRASQDLKINYDFNQEKIFIIGLSRTGTTSLDKAFKILGFNTAHWVNPRTRKILCLPDYFNFDVVSDSSIAFNFEYLFYLFPHAKFIVTTRDKDSWVKSVKRHFRLNSPQDFDSYYHSPSDRHSFYHRIIHQTLYANYSSWEQAYDGFYSRVEHFFNHYPEKSSKLLVIDICEGEGWEKLCTFIDQPIPQETLFPHTNKGE